MVNLDLLESYKVSSMGKDIRFTNSLSIPKNNNGLKNLVEFSIIKKRVNEFSQANFIKEYSENPLLEIQAVIERKETKLNNEFSLMVGNLRENINKYNGNSKRKFLEVESKLEHLSTINTFLNTNYDFETAKQQIRNSIYNKVHPTNPGLKKKGNTLKKIIYGGFVSTAILVGGMKLGSIIFPEKENIYTTIDRDFYLDKTKSEKEKIYQFSIDRNELLTYEENMVNNLVGENKKLKSSLK